MTWTLLFADITLHSPKLLIATPHLRLRLKVRPTVPWYNDEIKAAKRLRLRLRELGGERELWMMEYFQVLQKPHDVPHEPGQADVLH